MFAAFSGAPYSGERVSEHVQTLADGTHITQKQNSQKIWRDSQGRTRTEHSLMTGQPTGEARRFIFVDIHDPVAGYCYVIDDASKIVHRLAATPAPVRPGTPPAQTADQKAVAVKARTESTTEKLGTESIEGVLAEGMRQTHTIPVGEIGNDRPIVTGSESWISRELNVSVLSKFTDPRSGDNISRLINISRAEPDPSLFLPPAGYTVVEEKESFKMTVKRQ